MSIGHNNPQLKQFIERIERLMEEKASIQADITDIYAEAKNQGFDPKIMRSVVRLRKLSESERREQADLINAYLLAASKIEAD